MTSVPTWSGVEIRLLRKAKRMSLTGFAAHLGVGSRMVEKWEAGGRELQPRPVNQAALDSCLHRSTPQEQALFADLLAEANAASAPPTSAGPAGASGEPGACDVLALPGAVLGRADVDVMISRQDGIAASGVDGFMAMNEWWEAVVRMDRRAALTALSGLTTALCLGQPAAAADERLLSPDGDLRDILAQMRALHGLLAGQDNLLGAAAVLPTVVQQVRVLRNLACGASGAGRRAVLDLQAAFGEFAGWLSDDLGDRSAGHQWIGNALPWAHEADNEALVAYILMRQSQRAGEAGDAAATISLAQAAGRRGGLTHRIRAAAALAEACGHAARGDHVPFAAAIENARDQAEHAGPLAPYELAPWCTPAYVTAYEAKGWAALGRHAQAIDAYERALSGWPGGMQRDRGLYLGRLAAVHAAGGDLYAAAQAARSALAIARDTRSARILLQLRPLAPELEGCTHAPVRELAAELRRAISPARPENGVS